MSSNVLRFLRVLTRISINQTRFLKVCKVENWVNLTDGASIIIYSAFQFLCTIMSVHRPYTCAILFSETLDSKARLTKIVGSNGEIISQLTIMPSPSLIDILLFHTRMEP